MIVRKLWNVFGEWEVQGEKKLNFNSTIFAAIKFDCNQWFSTSCSCFKLYHSLCPDNTTEQQHEQQQPSNDQLIRALCHWQSPSRSAYDNRSSFDKNRFQQPQKKRIPRIGTVKMVIKWCWSGIRNWIKVLLYNEISGGPPTWNKWKISFLSEEEAESWFILIQIFSSSSSPWIIWELIKAMTQRKA